MATVPISIARRRALLAKRGLLFGSAAAFVATIALARSNHPASAAATSAARSSSQSTAPATSGFGSADVGPATASETPSVSTGAS